MTNSLKRQNESGFAENQHKKTKTIPIPPLVLNIDPDRDYFTKKTFYEPVEVKRFKDLLACDSNILKVDVPSGWAAPQWAMWAKTRRAHLNSILKNYDPMAASIKVQYRFADDGNAVYGRVYPRQGASAGEVCGDLRSYVLYGSWTAFDIVNCHPEIAYQVLAANGRAEQFKSLGAYCASRKQALKDIQEGYRVDRNQAKGLFIRLLYGGFFDTWAKDSEVYDQAPTPFIKGFQAEMDKLSKLIVSKNKQFASRIKPNKKSKDAGAKKKPGRPKKELDSEDKVVQPAAASADQIVSNFMQDYERRVLRHMYAYLVMLNLIDDERPECMLRYDGIDLPLSVLEGVDKEKVLKDMSDYVYDNTGFRLVMIEKPYEETPLKAEIDKQLDYSQRIPDKYRDELDKTFLINLKDYAAQKWYFEQFVSLIVHESNYVVVQRTYLECAGEAKRTLPTDNAVLKKSAELSVSFGNVNSVVHGDDGKPEKIKFLKHWLDDQEQRSCNSLGFLPYNIDLENFPGAEDKVFNLFKGYCLPRGIVLKKHYSKYTAPFHYIGLQLCANDPRVYQFFWNCIVNQFKRPRDRLRQAFVFQGKAQGTGLDVYMDTIGRLLGDNHYTNTAKVGDLIGDHAEGLEHRLLVVANELKFDQLKGSENTIKDLITTATKHTVNPKCVRPYTINMYALIVFASNNMNAISFDNDGNERRMNVFLPTVRTIWNSLESWGYASDDWNYLSKRLFPSPEFLQGLYDDIMKTDIANFDQERLRPTVLGPEYYRASEKNAKGHAKFFASMLRSGGFDEFKASATAQGFFNKNDTSGDQPWIIDEVKSGVNIQIPTSKLHNLFYEYVQSAFGTKAREDETNFKDLFTGNGVYSSVIGIKKNNVNHYVFNTVELWQLLVEKKWVTEACSYYREQNEEIAKELNVDKRFEEMAGLFENTAVEHRHSVNPGKQRPI